MEHSGINTEKMHKQNGKTEYCTTTTELRRSLEDRSMFARGTALQCTGSIHMKQQAHTIVRHNFAR